MEIKHVRYGLYPLFEITAYRSADDDPALQLGYNSCRIHILFVYFEIKTWKGVIIPKIGIEVGIGL